MKNTGKPEVFPNSAMPMRVNQVGKSHVPNLSRRSLSSEFKAAAGWPAAAYNPNG